MPQTKIRKRPFEEKAEQEPPFAYRSGWPYLSIGFGNERDYFVENLSLLVASGMGINAALSAIHSGTKNKRLKKVISTIEDMIVEGYPLWQGFQRTRFLPARIIALVRSGEESGRLPEHLNLVTIQQHKERIFLSRIRSALLYPSIVFLLAFFVGIGSAWYTLPKLVEVLNDVEGKLPLTTRWIINVGNFFSVYGNFAVPLIILGFLLLFYFLFIFSKTKFIGENIILAIPGVNRLIQAVELARFGYIFGALLQSGINLGEALESVREGTSFSTYRKFYGFMHEAVLSGNSFENVFQQYKKSDKFIPIPMQQLIVAAEKSGRLPETLLKIGQIFEEKTEVMSQDLSTVLEPIVLIIVGLVVGFIAIGLISPIYSLANQF
jgi:type II secretory pathway component PulF